MHVSFRDALVIQAAQASGTEVLLGGPFRRTKIRVGASGESAARQRVTKANVREMASGAARLTPRFRDRKMADLRRCLSPHGRS